MIRNHTFILALRTINAPLFKSLKCSSIIYYYQIDMNVNYLKRGNASLTGAFKEPNTIEEKSTVPHPRTSASAS